MAKFENMKGFIRVVSPVQELTDEKKTKIQYIVFEVPPYTDSFGETKSRKQEWLFQVLGDKKIKTMNLTADLQGKKASLTFYAESHCVESKIEGQNPMYFVNNTLAAYTIIP